MRVNRCVLWHRNGYVEDVNKNHLVIFSQLGVGQHKVGSDSWLLNPDPEPGKIWLMEEEEHQQEQCAADEEEHPFTPPLFLCSRETKSPPPPLPPVLLLLFPELGISFWLPQLSNLCLKMVELETSMRT